MSARIDARASDETAHLAGNEAIAIRADVTDPDSLQSAIRATVDRPTAYESAGFQHDCRIDDPRWREAVFEHGT
jgi:hypothetical protein